MNNTLKNIDISTHDDVDPYDKRRWHYIDLEEFEFKIRQEELEKHIAERRKERERRKWMKEAQVDLFRLTLIPRMCGILMIFMSIFMAVIFAKMGERDATWLMVTVPLGIGMVIMPGWNKPRK